MRMKQIDRNGFWQIKNNPISKVGIFPYLGKQIDDSLDPDKIYMVLRPEEELFNSEALESFNGVPVPLINEHTMLGEEYTPAEKKGVAGVVTNIKRDGDTLTGDISIYSEDMKEKITNGKKELSLGYFCSYDLTPGVFNGQKYDAIQRDIRSNHIALVDRGRCGSDVRVFDKWCFDCAIEKAEEKQTEGKITMATVFDQLSILKAVIDEQLALFKEEDHPRAKNGQFASKGQGGSGGGSSKATKKKSEATSIKQTGGNSSNAGGAGETQAQKENSNLKEKEKQFIKRYENRPAAELERQKKVSQEVQTRYNEEFHNAVDLIQDPVKRSIAEKARAIYEKLDGYKNGEDVNKDFIRNLVKEKGEDEAKKFLKELEDEFREHYFKEKYNSAYGNKVLGHTAGKLGEAISSINDGSYKKESWQLEKKKKTEKQEISDFAKNRTQKIAEWSNQYLKVMNNNPEFYKDLSKQDITTRIKSFNKAIKEMTGTVEFLHDNGHTKERSEAFKILTDLKEVKRRLEKGARLLKNKNSQDAAIEAPTKKRNMFNDGTKLRLATPEEEEKIKKLYEDLANFKEDTTSNSGLTASTDAGIDQSKLEELRNMIDKDKLLALKELVQMLEGEATTPEATADKEEDGDNDLDLLDDEGKEETEDEDKEEAGKLDFEDDEEEDEEEAKDEDTDESLIDLKDDEDKKKKEKKSEDELPSKIFKMLADRDSLVKKVKPIIGNFDFQKMTVEQVARYACDKLDIETSNPKEAINGYLKGYKRSSTYSLDSGIKEKSTTQSQIEAYLKGSK